MKTKTPKQINNILRTFRKNDKELYDNILQLADQMGIATKSAFQSPSKRKSEKIITESRKKQKEVQRFYERISKYYGTSYTDYQSRQKRRYEKYKQASVDAGKIPLKQRKWNAARKMINSLTAELFRHAIDSDSARDVIIIANDEFNVDEEKALSYLKREVGRLKNGKKPPDNPY